MLLALPPSLRDIIMQFVTVHARSLQALERRAVQAFKKTYVPEFFVLLTRPMRLGGALSCGHYYGPALGATSMTSRRVSVAVDVPIDIAGETGWPLPSRLRSVLPGPREMWTAGAIVGFGTKKSRGTLQELRAGLLACVAEGATRFVSLSDNRLPNHLPRALLEGRQLAMLHQVCPPGPELLAKFALFETLPAALCFHRSCEYFLGWAANNATKARDVECLGDIILNPEGLKGGWGQSAGRHPLSHVKKIGLSITTGRYSERVSSWEPTGVAENLFKTFPNLHKIGINLEVSYESASDGLMKIMNLLRLLADAGVHILSYEALLIQLPSSARKREERLQAIQEQLLEAGVSVTTPVRARSTKELPCDGFVLPASLWLSAPAAVCQGVSSALWQTVW